MLSLKQIKSFYKNAGKIDDRNLLREYLQYLILDKVFSSTLADKLNFMGGTCLRICYANDRFSEDLDFDNFELEVKRVKNLFEKVVTVFKREKYNFEFDFKKTKNGGRGRLRFSDLLYQLEISSNPKEKLMIRLDFTNQKRTETEVLLLAEFGMGERVVTNTLPVLLSQKTKALIQRKQTRGRDFYDIYWLLSKEIKPNLESLKIVNIDSEAKFFLKLKEIYQKEKGKIPLFKGQIRPFLIHEKNIRYLDFLGDIIKSSYDWKVAGAS